MKSKTEKVVDVNIVYNPFNPTEFESHELLYQPKKNLADYLVGLPDDVDFKVALNGRPIPVKDLPSTKVKNKDKVTLVVIPRGRVAKDILRMVAMIAVVVVAAIALTAIGGIWGLIAAAAIAVVGGFLVNTLLAPKPPKQKQNDDDGQSYSYDGARNTAKEGVAIPVIYGDFHVAGNYIDIFTENVGDDQYLYGRVVLSDGEITSVDTPSINEQLITDYKDVEFGSTLGTYTEPVNPKFGRSIAQRQRQVKLNTTFTTYTTVTAVDGIQLNLVFPRGLVSIDKKGNKQTRNVNVVAEYKLSSSSTWLPFGELNWTNFTGLSPVNTQFRLLVTPTLGTGTMAETATFNIEYRKLGDVAWTNYRTVSQTFSAYSYTPAASGFLNPYELATFNSYGYSSYSPSYSYDLFLPSGQYEFRVVGQGTLNLSQVRSVSGSSTLVFSDNRAKSIRRTVETGVIARGTYDVRVRRSSAEITNDDYIVEELWLSDVGEIQYSNVAVRSVATGWYKAKMTDQLNGVPNIVWPCKGVKVNSYDEKGNIVTNAWSANPAWITLDMLISERRGAFKDRINIDYPAFVSWAEYCDTNSFYFNGVFDTTESLWDALQSVFKIGRATPIRIGTKLSVAVDKPSQPQMLFGPGNIMKDTFSISYMSLNERANEFEVSYFDREDGNKQKSIRVVDTEANNRGMIPKSVSYSLFGVDNFEQAKKEVWYQLYMNRLAKRIVTFDAPVESIGLTIGDVALVQHDMVEWGTSGRIKNAISVSSIQLDKPVEILAGETYKLLVIHDFINLSTCNITSLGSNSYHLKNLTSGTLNPDNCHRIVSNTGAEAEIITFDYQAFNGTDGHNAIVYLSAAITGTTGTIKQVDAIEERTATNTVTASTDIITLSSPLSALPNKYANYMFGISAELKKPFRLRAISGEGIETRTLTFVEYNEFMYSPPEYEIPAPTVRAPKSVNHVSNLAYIYDLKRFTGSSTVTGIVSWTSGDIINYGGADIYVKKNDQNYTFYKTVLNVNDAELQFQEGDKVEIKVVAFNNRFIRANTNNAPTISQTLITSAQELNPVTALNWTLNRTPFMAAGNLSWTKPTTNIGPNYRIQIQLEGSSNWDDWGLTTENYATISELPKGTHQARVRTENNSAISIWTQISFVIATPTLVNPLVTSDGSAVDHVLNADGSADVSFEWSWAGNNQDIDGFIVTVYSSTSSSAYTAGADLANEQTITLTPDKRAYIITGVAANKYFTFYVKAYKNLHNSFITGGVLYSNNVKSTLAAENPYRPSTNVAFTGDITGTIAGTAASTVLTNISTAQTTANNAQTTANTASTNANTALTQISTIVSDGILDKSEKPDVVLRYTEIINEQAGIDARATDFGITTEKTNYDTAVSALTTYLTGLSPAYNSYTTDTTISRATFNTKFADVYSTRQILLNKIAEIAAQRAVWATITNRPPLLTGESVTVDEFLKDPSVWTSAGGGFFTDSTGEGFFEVAASSYGWFIHSFNNAIPVDHNATYEASYEIGELGSGSNTARFYTVVVAYDAAGNPIAGDGSYFMYPTSYETITIGRNLWEVNSGRFGKGTTKPFPGNAVKFGLGVLMNYDILAGAGITRARRLKCRRVDTITMTANNESWWTFAEGKAIRNRGVNGFEIQAARGKSSIRGPQRFTFKWAGPNASGTAKMAGLTEVSTPSGYGQGAVSVYYNDVADRIDIYEGYTGPIVGYTGITTRNSDEFCVEYDGLYVRVLRNGVAMAGYEKFVGPNKVYRPYVDTYYIGQGITDASHISTLSTSVVGSNTYTGGGSIWLGQNYSTASDNKIYNAELANNGEGWTNVSNIAAVDVGSAGDPLPAYWRFNNGATSQILANNSNKIQIDSAQTLYVSGLSYRAGSTSYFALEVYYTRADGTASVLLPYEVKDLSGPTGGTWNPFLFVLTPPDDATGLLFKVVSTGNSVNTYLGGCRLSNTEPSADVTSIITGPTEIIVECDSAGTPLTGQIPKTTSFKLFKNGTDNTSSATWSASILTGSLTQSFSGGGNHQITSTTLNSLSTIRLTANLNGLIRTHDVTVRKNLAPAPTGGSSGGGTSATTPVSYSSASTTMGTASSELIFNTGSAGTATMSGTVVFTGDEALPVGTFNAYWIWQRWNGSAWVDEGTETAAVPFIMSRYYDTEFSPPTYVYVTEQVGEMNVAKTVTGLTANAQTKFRLRIRCGQTTKTLSFYTPSTIGGTGS